MKNAPDEQGRKTQYTNDWAFGQQSQTDTDKKVILRFYFFRMEEFPEPHHRYSNRKGEHQIGREYSGMKKTREV